MKVRLPWPPKAALAVPLLYMAGLFALSAIPGDPEALKDSSPLQITLWVPPSLQNGLHIPVYTGLALVWCWTLSAWQLRPAVLTGWAVLLAFAYGLLDELHQGFVPGRQVSGMDVLLNGLGALLAWGLWPRWIDVEPGHAHWPG